MIRSLLAISITFIGGCINPSSKPAPTALQNRWAIDTLRYTAYYSSPNLNLNKWDVDITYFLEINNKGKYVIVRKSENSTNEYFEGTVPDSILSLTEAVLTLRSYDSLYSFDQEAEYTYDGDDYILDYQLHNKRNIIQFIPQEAPIEVQRISKHLNSFIFSKSLTKADTITLKGYEAEIERLSVNTSVGPPPKVEIPK